MNALILFLLLTGISSCTAMDAQAGPYDGEYRTNQQPWPYYNDSDKRREQDQRAGYQGSTDPGYDPDGAAKYRRRQEEQYWQERQQQEDAQRERRRQQDRQNSLW